MFRIKLYLVLFVEIFRVADCERRIQGGGPVLSEKTYAVYLTKAPLSSKNYEAWICGGALVSPQFILSSAACVVDVDYMYAIAGYRKYIRDSDAELDDCIKDTRKKVIYRCYPKKYELKYEELDYWSYIDIALLKVESPYDPADSLYQIACSYTPKPIVINYEKKFQDVGADVVVLGWGHTHIWRKEADLDNYNTRNLKYAPLLIRDKELCIREYEVYPNMSDVINEYMICASGEGNLDEYGKLIEMEPATADGCSSQPKLKGRVDQSCEEQQENMDNTRRDINANQTNNASMIDLIDDFTAPDNSTASNGINFNSGRRETERRENGICQNDHGGPLITWKGGREVLIGVASVFKVTNNSECIGPYLFTSTFCTSAFVSCILRSEHDTKRRPKKKFGAEGRLGDMDMCDSPASVRGFETIESHISWLDHPDGPAHNEKVGQHIVKYEEIDEVVNDRFAVHKFKVHTETYAEIAKKKYLETQKKAALKRKAAMEKKIEMERIAANERYTPNPIHDANKRYARDPNYEPNPMYEANKKYARATNYDANKMYTPNPIYNANLKHIRATNDDANKQYARNPMYNANKQYAPNPMYEANKQYAPNPMYEAHKQYAPNPVYEAHKQYAPNPMYEANEKYSQASNYDANKKYVRDPNYEANKQFTPNPIYKADKKF